MFLYLCLQWGACKFAARADRPHNARIATAFKHHITIIPVACDDFRPLRTNEIEGIPSVWGPEQQHSLACFGIRESDVTSAFLHLQALIDLRMPRFGTSAQKLVIIREILTRCQLSGKGSGIGPIGSIGAAIGPLGDAEKELPVAKPRILITGAVADAEALSICEVAEEMIQQRLQVACSVIRTAEEALATVHYASYVVVILSRGLLRDPCFAKIMMTVFSHKANSGNTPRTDWQCDGTDQGGTRNMMEHVNECQQVIISRGFEVS